MKKKNWKKKNEKRIEIEMEKNYVSLMQEAQSPFCRKLIHQWGLKLANVGFLYNNVKNYYYTYIQANKLIIWQSCRFRAVLDKK